MHGFPPSYLFAGPMGETYDMVIDSVMPVMAYVLGQAANDYFATIPSLAPTPKPLGYREVRSEREKQREEVAAILSEPSFEDFLGLQQLALWS